MASTEIDLPQSTMKPVIVEKIDQISSEIKIPTKGIPQDPYDEEESEQRFLLSKPTCFIIIGKPGSGKTALAQKFSQYWRCEFVNAQTFLTDNLKSSDDRASSLWSILSKGDRIPEELVLRLLEEKIESPEVRHHGYILDDYPTVCEDFMNIQDQFERIKTWKLTPDFIINLRIPDEDLLDRRINQKIDPETGNIYSEEVYNIAKRPRKERKISDAKSDDEGEEEEQEIEAPDELDPEIIKSLLIRPEDFPEHADGSIQKYKSNMLRILEEFMIDHDRDYVIELDAGQPVEVLVQQIVTKLQFLGLSPAAVIQRLYDEDEDDPLDDMESDEVGRILSGKKTVAAQYSWRKSRWGKNCPVALYEGNIIQGKPEWAVSFLDKMYYLSSAEFMDKFLRNPRPYLLKPYPKPPCKISVLGLPKSGKTGISHLLAAKYQAKVIQIRGRMEEELQKLEEKTLKHWTNEFTQNAIETVTANVKKQVLQEFQQRTEQKNQEKIKEEKKNEEKEIEEEKKDEEKKDEEKKDEEKKIEEEKEKSELEKNAEENSPEGENEKKKTVTEEQDQNAAEDTENKEVSDPVIEDAAKKAEDEPKEVEKELSLEDTKPAQSSQLEIIVEDTDQMSSPGENKESELKALTDEALAAIDANHPAVRELVEQLIKTKGIPKVSLGIESQFNILSECAFEVEKSQQEKKNSHIKNGGWILDGSPTNAEIWQMCAEKRWLPDNLIFLTDESNDYEWLMGEWSKYQPPPNLDVTIGDAEKIKTETEPKEVIADKSVTDTIVEDMEAEEAAAKADEFEPTETESKLMGEEEASAEVLSNQDLKEPTQPESESTENEPSKKAGFREPASKPQKQPKPGAIYKETLKKTDANLNSIQSTVGDEANFDPHRVAINNVKIEDVFEKVVAEIEKPFQYNAVEYSLGEMDEDDENFEEGGDDDIDEEEEAEEEEVEEENVHRSRRRHLGNTSYYCPVVLKDKGILCPGKADHAAKYASKLYYMSSADNLEQFIQNPAMYVMKNNPPVPPAKRFCIIGVHGSGKTVYGRYLARKLGLFHISFHERLQEMILKKTGKKLGPQFGDQEQSSSESENEDDDSDIEKAKPPESTEEELTDEEEAIKAYLGGESPLPIEILESIIFPWWFQEPYRSTGFILEGFPRNQDETLALQEFELLFDAAIILNVEDTDVLKRLLPAKMEDWRIKKNKQKERQARKKEKALKEKEVKIKKRREELEEELAERKRIKQERDILEEREMGEDELGDEDEDLDIEMLLVMEFQEEEEEDPEDEEETEEDVYEKFSGDLTEQFEIEAAKVEHAQDSLEEAAVPRIVIEAGRKEHVVKYVINKSLKPFVDFRDSIFERVYPVNENMAQQLLNQGYKQPSCLGYWCPVNHQENVTIQAMNSSSNQRYPCIYRQHIYFLSSTEARDRFIKNPLSFVKNKEKPRPFVPLKLAIIGPPKSGKTHLCNKFSEKYGAERLTVGIATRKVLETQPKSNLCSKILSYLCKGLSLPDELAIEALEVALLDINCQTKGYVLDGFPITKRQVELLNARKIIPVRVILMDIDSIEVVQRGVWDRLKLTRPYMKHDSGPALAMRYQVFKREINPVVEWYEKEPQNLYKINGKQSRWAVWEQVKEIVQESVSEIQNYLLNIKDGKAATLKGMCVIFKDFMDRLGDFGQFCPVSLGLKGELVDCSEDTTMDLVAEFRGYYYKMATKENLQLFMEDPVKFVPPNAPHALPPVELRPRRLVPQEKEKQLELKGYCPVTFLEGQCRYEKIVPGKPSFIVEYEKKFYSFASEENLDKFMRLPNKYSDLGLPHKLPPQIDPMDILQLPHLGFMEQSLATPLIRALVAVGDFKPKYPYLTANRSALLYVAYHLKAFNPRSSDYIRKKYQQKLKRFEKDCELIHYLSHNMTEFYVKPAKRSPEFNNNIDTFFALKGFEQSLTWIA